MFELARTDNALVDVQVQVRRMWSGKCEVRVSSDDHRTTTEDAADEIGNGGNERI